jgi:hypothetical protein
MKRRPQLIVERYVEYGEDYSRHRWKWTLKAANYKTLVTMNGYKEAYLAKNAFWLISGIARYSMDVITIEGPRKKVERI